MKKTILFFALAIANFLFAQKNEIPEALPGTEYGAGVSEQVTFNVYSTDKLINELEKEKELKDIVIQAKITGVCEKKGCWLTLENSQNITIFVKMKDYAFFVPTALEGKTVVLEGSAESKTTSVKELQHYAEDAKKSQAEIDAIKEPKTETRFLASAIKVVE